jgi:methionyl-tRNA synthetase
MSDPFYITTPIYYPNAEPHLGHVYTTLAADTVARYYRLCGRETHFLTGVDEHGIKMVKTAAAQGLEPKQLADRVVPVFSDLWKELGISNDDFLRTSSPRHHAGVQEVVRRLLANGDIYPGSYEGWYDEGQEEFVTETEAKNNNFNSAISGRPLVRFSEKSYFFKLSRYAPRVLAHIEAYPHFVQPESRRNEVVSKLKAGVEDLSISRATLKWGIPMPNDPEHVVYVWIDALSNYITALGFGSADDSAMRKFWPANVHLIGKEILWFHAVYWPAMLMSLDLELPKCVFAHGWWTSQGRKMSKSLGNYIDLAKLREVIARHGIDALRFYLLRAAPFGTDLDWTDADFNKSYTELADVVGNCLNRVLNMIGRYRGGKIPPATGAAESSDRHLLDAIAALPAALENAYAKMELQHAAMLPLELARAANGYIEATAPFKLAKDPTKADRLDTVLHNSARAMHAALVGLLPMLPEKARDGLTQLGVSAEPATIAELFARPSPVGTACGAARVLFPKHETGEAGKGKPG